MGKSGAGRIRRSSSKGKSGLSMTATMASQTSPRLCGGRLVAMPTAIPTDPLTSRLGSLLGKHDRLVAGTVVVGFEVDGLVLEVLEHFRRWGPSSGLRCTAMGRPGGSPSMEPKLPWPSTRGTRMFPGLGHTNQRGVDHAFAVGGGSYRTYRRQSWRICGGMTVARGSGRSWPRGCGAETA